MTMNTNQMPDHFDGWLERELKQQLSAITPINFRPGQARYQSLATSNGGGLFRLTKLKLAVAVAAGALAVGAAGAYAANTVTVQNPQSFTFGSGANTLTLVPVNGKPLATAPKWSTVGECVSFFAENRNFALAPAGTLPSTLTLFKNYHGKLVSFVASTWCKTQVASTVDSGTTGSGNGQGQNNGNGQGQNNGNSQGKGNGQGNGNHGNGNSQGNSSQGQGSTSN